MKKVLLLIFIFLLTGCTSNEDIIKEVYENFKKNENYSTSYTVDVVSNNGLYNSSMKLTGSGRIDVKNDLEYKRNTITNGTSITANEIYIVDAKKTLSDKYIKTGDSKWVKDTSNKTSLDANIVDFLKPNKEYESVKYNNEDYDNILLTNFEKSELKDLLSTAFGSNIEFKTASADYKVFIKENSISKIEFTLTVTYDGNTVRYSINAEYKNFNTTTIPAVTIEKNTSI